MIKIRKAWNKGLTKETSDIIRKASIEATGKKNIKNSESFKGEGNPNYKNGIRTGKRILLEIKSLCENCGTNKDLQIHHIDKNRNNNQLSNLVLLCRSCHSKEHRGVNSDWHHNMYNKKLNKLNAFEYIKNG